LDRQDSAPDHGIIPGASRDAGDDEMAVNLRRVDDESERRYPLADVVGRRLGSRDAS